MSVHVAITRRVIPGKEAEFQKGLQDFFHSSFRHDGVLGAHMIVPLEGNEFGILRTFSGNQERDVFYASDAFKKWDTYADTLTEGEAVYRPLTGLEAWFRGPGVPPKRWKMALATLIGVYPTSMFLVLTVGSIIHDWPLLVRSFVIAVCMVAILTWIVMPFVTKILRPWLRR